MTRACLLLLIALLPMPAFAQGVPRAQAENFLTSLQRGQVGPAYEKLFQGSNIGGNQAQSIARATQATLTPLGRVLGYELVREENFGASLSRLVYLLKSERHVTVWQFYFYRPANRWFVAEVNMSEKFQELAPKK
ncbi:MAG: hypothetical protein IT532_10050 [Burkholderiales bacterium]|nr:hypothetical protein [Burkholderiales bacterium]